MQIVGAKVKRDVQYANYGCAARHTKGETICSNRQQVSELKVERAVLEVLQELLLAPELKARIAASFEAQVKLRRREAASSAPSIEREIADGEKRIRNLTNAVAASGWSESLAELLRAEESALKALKGRRRDAQPKRASRPPDAAAVGAMLEKFAQTLRQDKEKAGQLLRTHVGEIVLTPRKLESPGRHYLATGAFSLAVTFDGAVRQGDVCGGRI